MKKKKYLPLYCKWMVIGKLPGEGLCKSFTDDWLFNIFCDEGLWYWGYNGEEIYASSCEALGVGRDDLKRKFTPLRQNIVLFMAAMNNEL